MNLFVRMECKNKIKITVLGHFAECCTRQRTTLPSDMVTSLGKARKIGDRKTIFPALPSVMTMALGKELKKIKLCRVPTIVHSAKIFFKKNSNFAECRPEGTRQRFFLKKVKLCRVSAARGHTAKNLKKIKLCRVLDRGHSAKILKKIQSLPSAG